MYLHLLEFEEIAELLIEKGADVSIVGFGAETALTQATNHGKRYTRLYYAFYRATRCQFFDIFAFEFLERKFT